MLMVLVELLVCHTFQNKTGTSEVGRVGIKKKCLTYQNLVLYHIDK